MPTEVKMRYRDGPPSGYGQGSDKKILLFKIKEDVNFEEQKILKELCMKYEPEFDFYISYKEVSIGFPEIFYSVRDGEKEFSTFKQAQLYICHLIECQRVKENILHDIRKWEMRFNKKWT